MLTACKVPSSPDCFVINVRLGLPIGACFDVCILAVRSSSKDVPLIHAEQLQCLSSTLRCLWECTTATNSLKKPPSLSLTACQLWTSDQMVDLSLISVSSNWCSVPVTLTQSLRYNVTLTPFMTTAGQLVPRRLAFNMEDESDVSESTCRDAKACCCPKQCSSLGALHLKRLLSSRLDRKKLTLTQTSQNLDSPKQQQGTRSTQQEQDTPGLDKQ